MKEQQKKLSKGIVWSFIDAALGSGVVFLVGIILARILTPKEFGIIGIVTIFIAISNSIVDSGFSNALIRKLNVTSEDYNTVFYFNLVVSLFLYLLLYIASPFIAHFFNEPLLIPVMRVIGIILIINGLAIIQRTIVTKNVDFKLRAKISIVSSTFSGIISIALAMQGFGVWSLVWQQLSNQIIMTLLFWLLNKWRPKLEYSWASFKELFSFGSKLLISGLIDTIYTNIYQFVIGKFYSPAQLGYYTRAMQFQMLFANNLTSIVQRVTYPVLSELQNNQTSMRLLYQKVIKITMMFSASTLLGLAAISDPLILNLLGEKWLPASTYLQIICFSGMLYPLHAINLSLLQVKGRSDLFLKLEIIKKFIGVVPVVIGIFYGIEYMLLTGIITGWISFRLNSYYSDELIGYSTWQQFKEICPIILIAGTVSFFVWLLSVKFGYSIYILILQILFGILFTIIIYATIKNPEFLEIKKWILKRK